MSLSFVAEKDFSTPWGNVPDLLLPAYGQTWLMVGITMVLVLLIGTPVGITLHNTSDFGLFPNPKVFGVLNTIVNIGRSLPFLILMTAIIPVTRFLVGTTIGIAAAIVPMTVAGVPFFARLVQNALREVRSDVTDMGQVSGGSVVQLIRTVQLSEALPALAGALTVNVIAMIEYSAIAGSIGAGGVGNLAITYGYNRFDHNIMIATVITLIVTIQIVQFAGDRLVKALTR
ncbi:ABC transporter permease [soil metagenome]